MFTLSWGYAQNGFDTTKSFKTLDDLVEFTNQLTDTGDYVVQINDEMTYGDYVPDMVAELIEEIEG